VTALSSPLPLVASLRPLRLGVAGLSLAAGAGHLAAAPAHVTDDLLLGAAFAVVAALQLVWAAAVVVSASSRIVTLGVAGHALVALAWLASRTAGLPAGSHAWSPEVVGVLDACTTLCELLIVAAVTFVPGGLFTRRAGARAVAAAAVVVLLAAPLAVAARPALPHEAVPHSH
jgi:hypothetical protein